MKVGSRNRYIRGNSLGSGQGGAGDAITTYSEVITLTQSFDITLVIDDVTLQIATNEPELFPSGQVVLINGSSDGESEGINDGLYEVQSALEAPGLLTLTFTEANLTTGLAEDGLLHIAKQVDVQHDLDTEDIIYRLKNVATGTTTTIEDDSTDNNKLILKPQVPTLGDFRVSVFAKK